MKKKSVEFTVNNGVAVWPSDWQGDLEVVEINQGKRGFVAKAKVVGEAKDQLLSTDQLSDLYVSYGKANPGDKHTAKVGDKFKNVVCSAGVIERGI